MKKNITNYVEKLFYTLICAMAVSYLTFYILLVVPAMRSAQEERGLRAVKELVSTTSQQFDQVSFLAKENAEWNSLYEILKDPQIDKEKGEFLGEIFTKDTLNLYELDYIGIFDRELREVTNSSNPQVNVSDLFQRKGKKYFFTSQPNGINRVKIASGYTNIEGRIYMFLSHIVLNSEGKGEAKGYLLFLKEVDEKDIFKLEAIKNAVLKLYIPGRKDKALIKEIITSKKSQSYYFHSNRDGTKTYYIPYFEGPNEIAYIIKFIVANEISHEVLLSFLTGMVPILILGVFVLHIKKLIHKKLVDPIISLYDHIISIKRSSKYMLMTYPEVENEIDNVIEAFNHLMIKVRDQKTNIENQKNKLEELAYIDHLTGLATRRLLDEKYSLLFESAKRSEATLTLIMMDIDYFKKYNDRYGHQEGDLVLKTIGKLMKSTFKREGDIVSRYGGEEFLVVLYKTSLKDAITLVEGFQENLKRLNIGHISSPFKRVTVSIGIKSETPLKDQSSCLLLKDVDRSLYKAKNSGRNKYSF